MVSKCLILQTHTLQTASLIYPDLRGYNTTT